MPDIPDPLIADAFLLAAQPKFSLRMVQSRLAECGAVSKTGEPISLARIHALLHDVNYVEATADRPPLVSKYIFNKVRKQLSRRRC